MTKLATLEARVKAVNRANKTGCELYQALRDFFSPLVGTQIFKKDGGLLAKLQKRLSEEVFPKFNEPHTSIYLYSARYSLVYVVKTDELVDGHTIYHEVSVYIGVLGGAFLKEIYTPFEGRSDYTVEEVLRKRGEYQAAKAVFEAAETALYPFGPDDR